MSKNILVAVIVIFGMVFYFFTNNTLSNSKKERKDMKIDKEVEVKKTVKIEYEDKKATNRSIVSGGSGRLDSSVIVDIVKTARAKKESKRRFLKEQERRFKELQKRVAYEAYRKRAILANAMLKNGGVNNLKNSYYERRFVKPNTMKAEGRIMAIKRNARDRARGVSMMLNRNQYITKKEDINSQIKRGENHEK